MSKILTLYFINVEQVHLGKDVFLTPYYLGKELGANVRIVYPMTDTNQNMPKFHRGVRLIPISLFHKPIKNRYWRHIFTLLYIIRFIVPSTYAMLFHYYSLFTPIYGIIYKTLNPWGKLYVKLDADIIALKYKDEYKNRIDAMIHDFVHWWFAKRVDCVSCETSVAFDAIMKSEATCYKFKKDMLKMYNGFDEERLRSIGLNLIPCEEKENLFITVARLGTEQKNTEMILNALARVDLGDWKFYLIGPIEKDFQLVIDSFYESHPEKRSNVIFTGPISSKREIWGYYNKAKVFVLTSTFEACALVLCEAYKFSNYIVSTDVGVFSDLVKNEKDGIVVEQRNDKQLSHVLEDIVKGNIHIDCSSRDTNKLNWDKLIKVVAEKMK